MASPRAGAQYWRVRAEEVRAQSDRMRDPASKRTILEIAESYDRMGDLAEKRTMQISKNETSDESHRYRTTWA